VAALAAGVASPAAAAGNRTNDNQTNGNQANDSQANVVPVGLRPGGALDKLIADLAARDEFSGTVRLTHRNRTVLARSYGRADKERAIPNGPETAFALASVTKLFTATAIAHLAQQGKLTYRAMLGSFLDGFPSSIADKVTVHHLLTHTSGLGDYHAMPGFGEAAASWTTQAQAMVGITEFIKKSELAFPPGAEWAYSNSGFHLLGAIVEKASGMSYFDYVRQNVFAAAGMTGTRFLTSPEWEADRKIAHPYHRDAQGQWVDGIPDFGYVVSTPAGDAFTTCADMHRFGRFLWQERIVDHGQTALMLSGKVLPAFPAGPPPGGAAPRTIFQCYGPLGRLSGGQWAFGHGGGNSSGVSTSIDIYPESDWTVVVLANYPNMTIQSISQTAGDLITG
jgi:CubicO group peptidase (beta-lactamase class C family)